MRFFTTAGLAALAAIILPMVGAAPTPTPDFKIKNIDVQDVVEGSYIVCYRNGVNATDIEVEQAHVAALMKKRNFIGGVDATYFMDSFKGYNIKADSATLAEIAASPNVAWIEKDAKVYASALTTQTTATYGLGRVSHRNKGSTSYIFDDSAGSGVRVYIIDTGILTTHQQFGGRAVWGANFVNRVNTDENGHGTHCAGTVAGSTFGVAKSATVVAVKVLDGEGAGSNSGVISGIQWVTNNAPPGSVLSMSLGGSFSTAVNNAVTAAFNAGITVVVAAGNENQNAANVSPASAPSAITVGAIDSNDAKPSFSNFGSALDIFAPGVNILSSWIGSNTATNTISGTSMACPHVAGLAAYLIGLEQLASPASVASRMKTLGTAGKITGAGSGSPNLIAYNGNGA